MSNSNSVKVFIGKEPEKYTPAFNRTLFFINIYNLDLAHKMFLETSKYHVDKYTTSFSREDKSLTSPVLCRTRKVYGRFWLAKDLLNKKRKVFYIYRKDLERAYGQLLGIYFDTSEGKEVFNNFLNILTPLQRSKIFLALENLDEK